MPKDSRKMVGAGGMLPQSPQYSHVSSFWKLQSDLLANDSLDCPTLVAVEAVRCCVFNGPSCSLLGNMSKPGTVLLIHLHSWHHLADPFTVYQCTTFCSLVTSKTWKSHTRRWSLQVPLTSTGLVLFLPISLCDESKSQTCSSPRLARYASTSHISSPLLSVDILR